VRLVTGGDYNSHANFPLPNSALVLKAGDTMTGLLAADGGLSVGATNFVTALAGKHAAQLGIAGTVDVLVSPASAPTTNRLVFLGGILVSNIANFYP